jgi:hypothetical protein
MPDRQTYDWDTERHAVEGEGGEGHDDNNDPGFVSLMERLCRARCLPEDPVANVSGLDVDGLIAGNDGWNGSYGRAGLQHIWVDDHTCGSQ